MEKNFVESKKNKVASSSEEPPEKTLPQHMRSYLFTTHVLWFTVVMFRTNYFYGTINPVIEDITGNDAVKVSYYTDVLSYTMAGAIIACVIIGLIYDWQKKLFKGIKDLKKRRVLSSICPLMTVCVASILLSTLAFVKEEYMLYLIPVIFTLFKSLFSTIANAYLVDVFPIHLYGSLYGVRFVVGNIFSLIQYALFEWSLAYKNADIHVNIFILCLCFATFVHPALILFNEFKASKRSNKIIS